MTVTKVFSALIISLTLAVAGAQGARLLADSPAGNAAAVAQVAALDLVRAEANLTPATKAALEAAFAEVGGWERWIAADTLSGWTVAELQRVRGVLSEALGALEGMGIDGQALLAGYRFGRYPGEYVDDRPYRLAAVNHSEQIITLADFAFGDGSGFTLYHELGHVIDQRLGRQLSEQFHLLIGSDGLATGLENDQATAEGYWLRSQSRSNRLEATADAFAVWVMVGYGGQDGPTFRNTPATVNHARIAAALQAALTEAAAD